MNRSLGWLLAAAALAAGGFLYGWQGVVVALTLVVFWLLLQFNRAVRVMKNAGHAPIGKVPSAVMLNAKLKPGMTMIEIVGITRSLGLEQPPKSDTWTWADEGGSAVTARLDPAGRLLSWHLSRPETTDLSAETGAPPASP
jgi:hypothetical protein